MRTFRSVMEVVFLLSRSGAYRRNSTRICTCQTTSHYAIVMPASGLSTALLASNAVATVRKRNKVIRLVGKLVGSDSVSVVNRSWTRWAERLITLMMEFDDRHTMTSQRFNQAIATAKRLADSGPVVVTHRGDPAYVLLSIDQYQELVEERESALEAS